MPRIIEYEQVLATLTARGMKSLYHNSGSFGLIDQPHTCGWIGADDPTIREAARAACLQVPEPHVENLARLFERTWTTLLPGPLWLMPGSHWAYELDFGCATWMPQALHAIGIDAALLQSRSNGAAIEFCLSEAELATRFATDLLNHLTGSDFVATFPDHQALCTIHHHAQLWWQTPDRPLHAKLSNLPRTLPNPNA